MILGWYVRYDPTREYMNSPINSNKRKGKIDKEFGYAEDKCFVPYFYTSVLL